MSQEDRKPHVPEADAPLEVPAGHPPVKSNASVAVPASPERTAEDTLSAPVEAVHDILMDERSDEPGMPEGMSSEEAAAPELPQAYSMHPERGGESASGTTGVSQDGLESMHEPADAEPVPPKAETSRKPPRLSPATNLEAGSLEKLFRGLSFLGLPVLILLGALLFLIPLLPVAPLLPGFAFVLPPSGQEQLEVLTRMAGTGWAQVIAGGAPLLWQGEVPSLAGTAPGFLPSLFYSLLHLADRIPGVDGAVAAHVAQAMAAALFFLGLWSMTRATGHNRRTAFAAGLLALTCLGAFSVFAYPGPELLFAGILALTMACFYRGWRKERALGWLTAAFVLAALAALCGGIAGLAVPLVASVAYFALAKNGERRNARDGLPGFFLMLVILALWIADLLYTGGPEYVRAAARGVRSAFFAGQHPWWFPLALLAFAWLPWTLMILFVDWLGTMRGLPAAWRERRVNGGRLWLWLGLILCLALFCAAPGKHGFAAVVLIPFLAALSAESLFRFTPGRCRWFFALAGGVFALTGLALVLVHFSQYLLPLIPAGWSSIVPPEIMNGVERIQGTAWSGGLLILLGLVLAFAVRRSFPGGSLLATTALTWLAVQAWMCFATPSLADVAGREPRGELIAIEPLVDIEPPSAFGSVDEPELPQISEPAPREERETPGAEQSLPGIPETDGTMNAPRQEREYLEQETNAPPLPPLDTEPGIADPGMPRSEIPDRSLAPETPPAQDMPLPPAPPGIPSERSPEPSLLPEESPEIPEFPEPAAEPGHNGPNDAPGRVPEHAPDYTPDQAGEADEAGDEDDEDEEPEPPVAI